MRLIHLWGAVALAFAIASTGSLVAQNTSIQRTVVQTADLSVPGREAVIARVVIGPFGKAGRHTHPGIELAYVLEGTVVIARDGAKPVTLKAGDVTENLVRQGVRETFNAGCCSRRHGLPPRSRLRARRGWQGGHFVDARRGNRTVKVVPSLSEDRTLTVPW